jgi:hypothetical protein
MRAPDLAMNEQRRAQSPVRRVIDNHSREVCFFRCNAPYWFVSSTEWTEQGADWRPIFATRATENGVPPDCANNQDGTKDGAPYEEATHGSYAVFSCGFLAPARFPAPRM